MIVSDNGPQFVSREFDHFCKVNGIEHVRVAPYHPRSNGEAERYVQIFKNALRNSAGKSQTAVDSDLSKFLYKYRSTPHTSTGQTPAKLLLGRELRTNLDLLHPQPKPMKRIMPPPSQAPRAFEKRQPVWVRFYNGPHKWRSGVVRAVTGPLSYEVQVGDQMHSRHADQLRARTSMDDAPPMEVERPVDDDVREQILEGMPPLPLALPPLPVPQPALPPPELAAPELPVALPLAEPPPLPPDPPAAVQPPPHPKRPKKRRPPPAAPTRVSARAPPGRPKRYGLDEFVE